MLPLFNMSGTGFPVVIAAFISLSAMLVWWIGRLRRKNHLLEQHARQLKEHQAALLDLMQEKKHVVSLLAHELRSPLALTIFNTEHLLSRKGLREHEKQDLEEIGEASMDMEEIIQKIVQFENLDEPLPNHFEMQVDEVIQQSIARYSSLAREKQLSIEWKAEPDTDFKILGNPYLFMQVFNNLLSNAIKFSHSGQKVSVFLHRRHDVFEIRVKDQGMGMGEAELAQIFQKYYRKNEANGHMPKSMGLGLYLVKWFIDRLQGQIKVQSTPGEGTEFIVILPALPAEARSAKEGLTLSPQTFF